MTEHRRASLAFNSSLETGIRSIGILVAANPMAHDLQRMVAFDYMAVHTGDIVGPESLHPKLPMRSAELLVRRGLVEKGLMLMISKGLAERIISNKGITYKASEFAEEFLISLSSPYLVELQKRSQWAVGLFGKMTDDAFYKTINGVFDRWIEEFQTAEEWAGGKL